MQRLCQLILRFAGASRGIALMEFALVFPFIMLMLLGGLEVSRAIVITQRTEKVGYVIADITSQYLPATSAAATGELSLTELTNNVFPQFSRMMGTYADTSKQAIILTSVVMQSGVKKILWQAAGGGSLTTNVVSVVNGLSPAAIGKGVQGAVATFTGGTNTGDIASQLATMVEGENMIVAEVFYSYQPVWASVIGATTAPNSTSAAATIASPKVLVKRMFFRPRNGSLTCLPPTFTTADCLTTTTTSTGGASATCAAPTCTAPGTTGTSCCVANGTSWSHSGGCIFYTCSNGTVLSTILHNSAWLAGTCDESGAISSLAGNICS